jgi:hypothetical protein
MRLLWAAQRVREAADIAKAAAPYCHAKLSSVEHTGKDGEALVPARVEVVFVDTECKSSSRKN